MTTVPSDALVTFEAPVRLNETPPVGAEYRVTKYGVRDWMLTGFENESVINPTLASNPENACSVGAVMSPINVRTWITPAGSWLSNVSTTILIV